MPRFSPYLGIVVALALGVLVAVFSGRSTVSRAPVSIAPPALPAAAPNKDNATATSTPTPTAPPQKKVVTAAPPSASSTVEPVVALAPLLPPENVSLDASASALRAALVNILCRVSLGRGLQVISGTGVFIDSKGVILTNAHIAEYFLLVDRGASCIIRSGSPAVDRYRAALIFISPAWIRANAQLLGTMVPSGTGEYDYALLAVTKGATESALPSSFPSIPLATAPLALGAPVVIGSYGAQFLDQSQIQTALSPTLVFGSVKDVFTFNTNTVDVLALGGSAAAQEGSSGGGVIGVSGALAGTITTSTIDGPTNTRSLNAITASYIRADYASETGQALDLLLSEPTAISINNFAPQIPALEALVTAHL